MDMCAVMNNNPMSVDEMAQLAKSIDDPRLENLKTQMWTRETLIAPNALTNANVISLVSPVKWKCSN